MYIWFKLKPAPSWTKPKLLGKSIRLLSLKRIMNSLRAKFSSFRASVRNYNTMSFRPLFSTHISSYPPPTVWYLILHNIYKFVLKCVWHILILKFYCYCFYFKEMSLFSFFYLFVFIVHVLYRFFMFAIFLMFNENTIFICRTI